jgi:hypothetical protein
MISRNNAQVTVAVGHYFNYSVNPAHVNHDYDGAQGVALWEI